MNIAKLPEVLGTAKIRYCSTGCDAALSGMEKHELGKPDFDLIDDAFKALLQSHPDPMTADKIADLRD